MLSSPLSPANALSVPRSERDEKRRGIRGLESPQTKFPR